MEARQLHAIEIRFATPRHCALIVWPADCSRVCARLINSRRTWTTARAGDAVLLKREGSEEPERVFIREVAIYRGYPTTENERVISTAANWLSGE